MTTRVSRSVCSMMLLSAGLMAQQAASPVLETNSHRRQIEAAVYAYFQAVDMLDPQHYAALFAPDGTLEDPVGTGMYHGRTEIAGALAAGLPIVGRLTPRVKDIFVGSGQSTEAAVYWVITGYTKQGKQLIVQGIGIFKFKSIQNGAPLQLDSVREFYDPVQYASQIQ
jgi:ketosteroid isomerase-like protein